MFGIDMHSVNNMILEQFSMCVSVVFMSALIGITIYVLTKSWDEGKERALVREENEKQEELNRKRLENLKLENLEIKLTADDMELLKLMTGVDKTVRGTLRSVLRDHLKT